MSVALKFQVSWFCVITNLHIWFRLKFDLRKLPTLLIESFLIKLISLSQMSTFYRILNQHWKCREQKNFSDNPCHNILEL